MRINIDETSICLFQGKGSGTVFVRKSVQRATLNKRRKYLSHVACACDQPHLQRLLPQFLVGNERVLPARAMARLRAAAPGFVRLLRRKSSWLNDGLFATILRAIVAALGPYLHEYQVIFMFDAARIHCTSGVFETCFRLGAWPLLISARMTWLLQMLDTRIRRVQGEACGGIPGCSGA